MLTVCSTVPRMCGTVFSFQSLVAYCVLTVRAVCSSWGRRLASKLFHENLLLSLSMNEGEKKNKKREKKKKIRSREIIVKTFFTFF